MVANFLNWQPPVFYIGSHHSIKWWQLPSYGRQLPDHSRWLHRRQCTWLPRQLANIATVVGIISGRDVSMHMHHGN